MSAKPSIDSIFCSAIEIESPDERRAQVEQACGEDADLKRQVERLLHAHFHGRSILDAPVQPVATVDEPHRETAGAMIGPYKLLEELGEGGMGTVWMAQQTEPVKRLVALKVIKAGMDSREVLARFAAERQALALMDHPNIAKVHDAGVSADGRPYFVMELVKGAPITRYCDERRLTPRQRLELFVPVCQAVQHAHQKGIIHRDLKPSNVLVALYDDRPVPKVIDFGVAKATGTQLNDVSLHTGFGAVVGTVEYMSPEQAGLNQLDVDTRSDIYSLGVLLYELLAGSPPFTRKELEKAGVLEMLCVIREQEPSKPSMKLSTAEGLPTLAANRGTDPAKLTRLVRGDLDWIVMKALEKDRSRRYETANGFAMDLQRYLCDEPVNAGPPSAWYRLRKSAKRNRVALTTIALVALGLLAGTAVSLWQALRAVEAETLAEKRLEAETAAHAAAVAAAKAEAAERIEVTRQKERAEQEAAIARAVNDFLHSALLGQADIGLQPFLGEAFKRNPNITVAELLDRAAQAIEGKFRDQPLTEAAIRLTLGDTYRSLGRYAKALPHLERSICLRTAQLGANHPDTLTSRISLAGLYHDQGDLKRAEALTKEVLTDCTTTLEAGHTLTLTCKSNLALLYRDQGNYERAEPLFKEVLAARTVKLGADHPDTLKIINNLASVYSAQGKYDQAEPLFQEALAVHTRRHGADHPLSLVLKDNLALVNVYQGKYDQAERLIKEVLLVEIPQRGADHPDTLITKHNLAFLYSHRGKNDLAEAIFKELLDARTRRQEAAHPRTLVTKRCLADVYLAQRKDARAEALYQEVLTAFSATPGADHLETLNAKQGLATLYQHQGKYNQAEPLYHEVIAARTARLGADHPDTLTSRNNLAMIYERQKKYDAAEALTKEVLAARTVKLGADHPLTLASKNNLAFLYQVQEKYDLAETLHLEVLAARTAKLGVDHPDVLQSKSNLAGVYHMQRQYARAESLLNEVVPAMAAKRGEHHPLTLFVKYGLAELYQVQEKYNLAEPLWRDLDAGMTKAFGAKSPQRVAVLERLVLLYEKTAQNDRAAEYRKKLNEARADAPPPKR
jgi:serine/threonine protein kinase/tetratricopeptide (TPR) repeat protein